MTTAATLGENDLRFINVVASRLFSTSQPQAPAGLDEAIDAVAAQHGPFTRAAATAYELLSRRVFATAPLSTALLAMVAQLEIEGRQLLAPQGAIAGMIRELQSGSVDAGAIAAWLEDRAVPASSGW